MAKNSSDEDSKSLENTSNQEELPKSVSLPSDAVEANRKLYFINEIVEWQLTKYIWTGCTDVELRDSIMSNAAELIRQIIRKQGLHTIYPGQEESAFGDLLQTAWVQIEKTLYKYRSRPYCRLCYNPDRPSDSVLYIPDEFEYGIKTFEETIKMHKGICPKCGGTLTSAPIIEPEQGRFGGSESILYRGMSKVFNMWSQVARTVILAYIKKESRDRRNATTYKAHLSNKHRPLSDVMIRFFGEAREMCKFNDDHLAILNAIEALIQVDDKPWDGIIGKLVQNTGMPRSAITGFMKIMKLRSLEFTDSPININSESVDQSYDSKKDMESCDD